MLEIFLSPWGIASAVIAVGLFSAYVYFCAWKIFWDAEEIERISKTQDLVAAVQKSNLLQLLWKNFEKMLTAVDDKIYSTIDAAEIFNPQNLTRGMNMTFWQSYGGIFTGLGILGTFIGLTFGLSNLNMTSGDVEVLQEGIKQLLSGVESAFVTSLVGIFCAIIYSFIHHGLIKKFQGNVQNLADKLDEKFPRCSVEDWLRDINFAAANHLDESQRQTAALKIIGDTTANHLDESREQTAVLKSIGEQIAEAMFNAFEDKLAEHVEKICAAIDALGKGAAQGLNDAMSKVAGAQMDRFSAALDKFSDRAEMILSNAQEVSRLMNEQLLNTLKELDENLKRHAQASADERAAANAEFFSTLDGLSKTLQEVADNFKENMNEVATSNAAQISEAVDAFSEIVNRHNATTKEMFNEVQKLLTGMETYLELMDNASTTFKQAAEPVKQSTLQLTNNLTATSAQIKNLSDANQKTNENLLILTTRLNIFMNNFKGIAGELERSTKIIEDSLRNYNYKMSEGLSDALTKFDSDMEKAVREVHMSVEELTDVLENLKKIRR